MGAAHPGGSGSAEHAAAHDHHHNRGADAERSADDHHHDDPAAVRSAHAALFGAGAVSAIEFGPAAGPGSGTPAGRAGPLISSAGETPGYTGVP